MSLCPECNGPVRPDVVLFGVPYDEMQVYLDELHKGFDLYFWVGTTGLFPYIQRPILDA